MADTEGEVNIEGDEFVEEASLGDSGEEYGESDEDVPEIILPSAGDIQAHTQAHASRAGVTNYLQNPIHLLGNAARQAGVKSRTKTSVLELDIDTLEDKPWRKPGVDITQYFNYGFNEDTWRAYCHRQHQMKMESQNLGKIAVYESNREDDRPVREIQEEAPVPVHKPSYHSHQNEDDSAAIELVGSKSSQPSYRDPRAPQTGSRPIPVAPSRGYEQPPRHYERERDRAGGHDQRIESRGSSSSYDSRVPSSEMRSGYESRSQGSYDSRSDRSGDRDRGYESRKRERDPRDSRSERDSRDPRYGSGSGRDRRDERERDEKRARHS